MDYRSEEERKREKEKEKFNRYRANYPEEYAKLVVLQSTNPEEYKKKRFQILYPDEYAKLVLLQSTNPEEYTKKRLQIFNPEEYRVRYPEGQDRRKYDLSGIPTDLPEDKGKAIGLKIEIENHILEKLSDYIISNHPRGNYTVESYRIAIINVLKNIFKDPNSDIINYIETKLKSEPDDKKGTFGFFGWGGKTKRTRRKNRRR